MPDKYKWFDGYKFTRDDNTGYYLNSTIRKRLHRYVWEYHNGEIPEDCEIHHIDSDKSNNDIDNLKLIKQSKHRKLHGKKRYKNDEEWFEEFHNKGIEKAKDWHKSEEGSKWHKKQYKKSLGNRKQKEFICKQCGKKFKTIDNGHNKFCSNKCKSAWRRKTGKDDIKRTCIICGNNFTANKYSDTKTCSGSCASKLAYQNRMKKNAAS